MPILLGQILVFVGMGLWLAWSLGLGQFVLGNYVYRGGKQAIVREFNCGSDRLILAEKQSYAPGGLGDRGTLLRTPLLLWNGKLVSNAWEGRHHLWGLDVGLPLVREDLIGISEPNSDPAHSWTVYVSPKKFTPQEFQQLLACYQQHQVSIGEMLAQDQVQPWWANRGFSFDDRLYPITAVVYGDRPEPEVYYTQQFRTGTLETVGDKPDFLNPQYVQFKSDQETLTIYPNGICMIDHKGKKGTHSWGGTDMVGQVVLKGGNLTLRIDKLPAKFMEDSKPFTDLEYLGSFSDKQGHTLLEKYQIDYNIT